MEDPITGFWAAGTQHAEDLGQDDVGGTASRPVWLEQSEGERGSRGKAGRGRDRSCRALWARGRSWAFTPREVGALEDTDGSSPDSFQLI